MNKLVSREEGKCPECGSININYDTIVVEGRHLASVYYPCDCPKCDACFSEFQRLTYIGTYSEDNQLKELED